MATKPDLGVFLREQRKNAELSLRQLAEQTGLSNPYLSQIENGLRKPSAEALQKLAGALRVSAEVLYVRAGLIDPEHHSHSIADAIAADTALSERQKVVLLDIYESFVRGQTADPVPTPTADSAPEPLMDAALDAPASAPAAS